MAQEAGLYLVKSVLAYSPVSCHYGDMVTVVKTLVIVLWGMCLFVLMTVAGVCLSIGLGAIVELVLGG